MNEGSTKDERLILGQDCNIGAIEYKEAIDGPAASYLYNKPFQKRGVRWRKPYS